MLFDVILPLAIEGVFTYNIPDVVEPKSLIGMRVLVPLGAHKQFAGIVWRRHTDALPEGITVKDSICMLDERPVVTQVQFSLWEWVASYYMCTLGEVMKAALPAPLKLESETHVRLNEEFVADKPLSDTAQKILELLLDRKERTIDEIGKKAGLRSILPTLRRLQESGAVLLGEQTEDRYRAKTEKWVRLSDGYRDNEGALQLILNALQRAQRQHELLVSFLHYTEDTGAIRREELLSLTSSNAATLKSLTDKGILTIEDREVDRLYRAVATQEKKELNIYQREAFNEIKKQFADKDTVLLHGVTGSGKTEIYIHLIEEVIAAGKQVLYLVPEIALTTQLTERLQSVFGERLGVYHSRFSDAERMETYRNLAETDKYSVVLGVRSSLFLPFKNLGMVIVDEEQDDSYKQQDPAPRYHARNGAIVLAHLFGAKTLLGTATPAVESYYNAQTGRYGLVKLEHRHADLQMPHIRIIDTKLQYHRKQMQGHFADEVIDRITNEIGKNKQVIVFQNRRGYAPWLECKQCAWVPKCANCDVSLTLHRRQGTLVCHYCGYTIPIPSVCPVCKQPSLKDIGLGTEKVEDELQQLFPTARVSRMDQDTTRSKNAYQRLINDFASHKTDILVGTQMVSKGLHFDEVSTVAVLNADTVLNQPDYRSAENAYQMLEQVSGRAGRKGQQGEVLIQTSNPANEVLKQVASHDYEALYNEQISEREAFKYPPFTRLLVVTIRHRDIQKADSVAALLQSQLQEVFGRRCSRVTMPLVSRVQNQHIRQILLKIGVREPWQAAKDMLAEQIRRVKKSADGKSATIYTDVDPI